MPLTDGWCDLPSGGAVEIKNGFPVRIWDGGISRLDELNMLKEAERVTEIKLIWHYPDRAQRWRSAPIWSIFTNAKIFRWNFARIHPDACERCGNEVGIKFVTVRDSNAREWLGEECLKKSDAE